METQPVQSEVKATPTETKTSHSVVGCLSAIFAVFALSAVILFVYLVTSDLAGSGLDILGTFSIGIAIICTLPALILGIIGLFPKNRKKLFAVIGVSISGLIVLVPVAFYGALLLTSKLSASRDFSMAEAPSIIPTSTVAVSRVVGRVTWNGNPVQNSRFVLKKSGNYNTMPEVAHATADSNGYFVLENPPIGDYGYYAVSPSDEYWEFAGGNAISITNNQIFDVGTLQLYKKIQLLEPTNGATINTSTPTLRWEGFPGADGYQINIFDHETHQEILRTRTTDNYLVIEQPLARGTQYAWSVDAFNTANGMIAYYGDWYFSIQP